MMFQWITTRGYTPVIIATKADKLKRSQIQSHLAAIRRTLNLVEDYPVIPFSSETKQGREEVWNMIDEIVSAE